MASKKDDTTDIETVNVVSGEIVQGVKARSILNDDALHELTDFASAMAVLENLGVLVEGAEEYGTGFSVADKTTLIDVPFIALQWRFSEGDFGTFVTIHLMTEDGRKLIINDGSTGIREQMETVTRQRMKKGLTPEQAHAGLAVRKGLTVSEYDYYAPGADKPTKAKTFYITT